MEIKKIFILVIIASCSVKEEKAPNIEKKDTIKDVQKVEDNYDKYWYRKEPEIANFKKVWNAINNNNEELYKETATWFRFHPCQNDFMFYSIIMAYKNNSPSAHYDIFRFYNRGTGICKKKDTVLLNFILYNLARAHELNYKIGECNIDGIIVDDNIIKKSGYYLNKMPHL